MTTIQEEMAQSRRAAEELSHPKMKDIMRQTDAINEKRQRTRAEMMARHSGGRGGLLDFMTTSSDWNLFKEYKRKGSWDSPVYTGAMTPREYFAERPDEINYTGIGRITKHADNLGQAREVLKVTDFASRFKNDFVSSLYNGEIPLEELGVSDIDKGTQDIYRKILGKNYTHVTGGNFRGYQLAPETIPFSAKLDEKVRKGEYSQKLMGYSIEGESDWKLGDTGHFYDAGSYQIVTVEHNGKKYYKLVDVFDTAGTNDTFIDKGINDKIAKYEIPYVVSTPWREVPDGRK